MSRFRKKGGAWRNSEDEILKAAVMKYGRNQSSRVAYLLQNKSSKQCKARWTEWLDPSIKKTEWSVEEDEKLLHLAKLMPSQWSTIAPIVGGRTATQCIERFEVLLNQGQAISGDSFDNIKKLKPEELDPNPESKPALPDSKDLDQEELEMLAEVRARLANTQGKKAKRKAWSKHTEDATRLAAQQKRVELKAAEIPVEQNKKKKTELNYNADMSFEKMPVPGLYDTVDEQINSIAAVSSNSKQENLLNNRDNNVLGSQLDNERMLQIKNEERMSSSLMSKDPSTTKNKLVLPKPQVCDTEKRKAAKLRKIFEHFDGLS